MKKSLMFLMCLCLFVLIEVNSISAQTCGSGITYTTNFPRVSGGPTISTPSNGIKYNDTTRLQNILTQCSGKIIFNESEYYINGTLPVFSYRIIEGTGTSTNKTNGVSPNAALHPSSKIIQTANLPIFKIGTEVVDVAIRDIAMIGGIANSNVNLFGIYAESGLTTTCTSSIKDNCSSIGFQFSNLHFANLNKGFYINARNAGEWQFDNVKLDHARFQGCIIGIHVNTLNGGVNFSNLDFFVPEGLEQGDDETIVGKTYGIYLQRSTYTSMDWIEGNGPTSGGPPLATALIYIKEHHNLSIQNMISEGFRKDLVVDGNTRNYPISIFGSQFQSGVSIKNATIYSTGNQYSGVSNNLGTSVVAKGYSQIYSIGDKFCQEGAPNCDEGRGFTLEGNARVIYSTNQAKTTTSVPFIIAKDVFYSTDPVQNAFTNAPHLSLLAPTVATGPLLRLGRVGFYFDISRSEQDATMTFTPSASQIGYAYTFNNRGGTFNVTGGNLKFSDDAVNTHSSGTLILGTTTFANLGTSASNGTMWYCSDCNENDTCGGSGSGSIAKKLQNRWTCD